MPRTWLWAQFHAGVFFAPLLVATWLVGAALELRRRMLPTARTPARDPFLLRRRLAGRTAVDATCARRRCHRCEWDRRLAATLDGNGEPEQALDAVSTPSSATASTPPTSGHR